MSVEPMGPYDIHGVGEIADMAAGDCVVCGERISRAEFAYHKKGVCSRCTVWLLNNYNMQHGGEWLTWPNPAREMSAVEMARRTLTKSLKLEIFERDQYRCVACGSHKSLECDHVVPLSAGGTNDPANLQTLCGTCNAAKGAKTMDEWIGGGGR